MAFPGARRDLGSRSSLENRSMFRLSIFGALSLVLVATPALAASTRIWVSGHGVDQVGCGAPVSPCRSLQFAHDNVATGGEVDILDPAGYGAVIITKAISI